MATLTEGVVAAPIEGIDKVQLGKNDDGSQYIRIFYSGPMRSAGEQPKLFPYLLVTM